MNWVIPTIKLVRFSGIAPSPRPIFKVKFRSEQQQPINSHPYCTRPASFNRLPFVHCFHFDQKKTSRFLKLVLLAAPHPRFLRVSSLKTWRVPFPVLDPNYRIISCFSFLEIRLLFHFTVLFWSECYKGFTSRRKLDTSSQIYQNQFGYLTVVIFCDY